MLVKCVGEKFSVCWRKAISYFFENLLLVKNIHQHTFEYLYSPKYSFTNIHKITNAWIFFTNILFHQYYFHQHHRYPEAGCWWRFSPTYTLFTNMDFSPTYFANIRMATNLTNRGRYFWSSTCSLGQNPPTFKDIKYN